MKTMDIKHGSLVKTVQHAADTIKRHSEFDARLVSLLEQYSADIVQRYREILTQQDMIQKRNPLHFAAMNKAVHSQKTLEALLKIDFETVPGWDNFIKLHDQLQGFEESDEHFDPRKSEPILKQFRELLEPKVYKSVVRDFK